MKYKYLLFDLDGTLIDTMKGVVNCVRHSLLYFGIEAGPDEELQKFLGPPLKDSYMKYYGFSKEKADEAIRKYRERYSAYCIKESKLYNGIPETLASCLECGYIMGVATSKYEQSARKMLSEFGIAKYFAQITGSNLSESISTKQQVIEEALRRFGISDDRKSVLMVGDMKYDDEGARLAGIDCLGVYTGTAKKGEHEAAGATYIAHSIDEMQKMLLSFHG